MARCSACNAEFEGAKQDACPSCGAARPRPRVARPAPAAPAAPAATSAPPRPRPGAAPSGSAAPPHASEFIRVTARPGTIPAAPAAGQGLAGDPWPSAGRTDGAARSAVIRTVIAAIGLGVVVLVIQRVADDPASSVSRRLMLSSAMILALYVAVGLLVRARLADGRVRPEFMVGRDTRAIGVGVATGLGGGLLIVGLNSLISGRISSDVNMVAVLYERQWLHVAIIIAIAVIAAPLVEELLFRGLLVESLRDRGKSGAILGGAVAFSLWHLNPAALRYYVLMGFFLGLLYWSLGINGSITAHAVFNATLIVFAFAVIGGAPQPLSVGGVSLDLPAGWQQVDDRDIPAFGPVDLDLAVQSPTGSAFVIQHVDRQGPAALLPDPSSTLPPGAQGAYEIAIAEGRGTRFSLPDAGGGVSADTIVTARGPRVFILTFISAGSEQAQQHYERMLATLSLPAA